MYKLKGGRGENTMGSTEVNEQIKMKISMCEALWEAKRYWGKRTKSTTYTNAFDQIKAELKSTLKQI